jgi:hypothetical protein
MMHIQNFSSHYHLISTRFRGRIARQGPTMIAYSASGTANLDFILFGGADHTLFFGHAKNKIRCFQSKIPAVKQ